MRQGREGAAITERSPRGQLELSCWGTLGAGVEHARVPHLGGRDVGVPSLLEAASKLLIPWHFCLAPSCLSTFPQPETQVSHVFSAICLWHVEVNARGTASAAGRRKQDQPRPPCCEGSQVQAVDNLQPSPGSVLVMAL